MSRVLQAVDSIHQVGIYCLALVQPNHLPKVRKLDVQIAVFYLHFGTKQGNKILY